MTFKRVSGNFSKPADHAKLCLRDGGQPLPSGANNLLAQNTPMIQRPDEQSYFRQAVDAGMDKVGPYIDKAVEFNEQYPAVGQAAQTFIPAVNLIAGAGGIAQAVNDRDLGAGVATGVGMIPVVGKYANKAFLSGTAGVAKRLANGVGMSPDFAKAAVGRVGGDVGAGVQAYELGRSTKKTTQTLRGDAPGPFYGGN